jgi:hypothetical protein
METDDIFRSGELNPNISSNFIWKLFRPLALPLVGVTTPQFKLKLVTSISCPRNKMQLVLAPFYRQKMGVVHVYLCDSESVKSVIGRTRQN